MVVDVVIMISGKWVGYPGARATSIVHPMTRYLDINIVAHSLTHRDPCAPADHSDP